MRDCRSNSFTSTPPGWPWICLSGAGRTKAAPGESKAVETGVPVTASGAVAGLAGAAPSTSGAWDTTAGAWAGAGGDFAWVLAAAGADGRTGVAAGGDG